MKFLIDQDVYVATVQFLISSGHDVLTAAQLGLSRADDQDVLRAALADSRIFVTRDRDFGNLVFVQGLQAGVIYLRVLPSTIQAVHTELARVLQSYSELEFLSAFVVVEAGTHRIRRLTDNP